MGLIALLNLTFYTVLDAIEQSIDHHKGGKTLYDFWHLTRLLSRLILWLVGVACGGILYHNGIAGLLILLILAGLTVPLKFFVWNKLYHDYWEYWVTHDNEWQFSTGSPWLDRFLGFDKNPSNN